MRIAICDDEKEIREELGTRVRRILPDASVTLFSSGEALLYANAFFDIVLLDVEMPGADGLAIAAKLRERTDGDDKEALFGIKQRERTDGDHKATGELRSMGKEGNADDHARSIVIFVTGYERYMPSAFDVRAFHYLVKPVREEKLREVLSAAARECERHTKKERRFILLKAAGASQKIFLDEITYLESNNKKVTVHLTDGAVLEAYRKMEDMEKLLGASFYRCHRGYLVNLRHIKAYNAEEITVTGNGRILIAHRKYGEFVKTYLRYARDGGAYVDA